MNESKINVRHIRPNSLINRADDALLFFVVLCVCRHFSSGCQIDLGSSTWRVYFYFPTEAHTVGSIPARRPHCLPPYMLDNNVSFVLAASSAPRGGDVASVTLTDSCSINPLISSRGARFNTLRLWVRVQVVNPNTDVSRCGVLMWFLRVPLLSFPPAVSPPLPLPRRQEEKERGDAARVRSATASKGQFFWYSVRMTVSNTDHRRAGD